MSAPWSVNVRMSEVPDSGLVRQLQAGASELEGVRRELDLLALERLEAEVRLKPWFDGVEVSAAWSASFAQSCSVSLERLDQRLSGDFLVHVVPNGSLHAPTDEQLADIDLDAVDPPDVSEDGTVDIAALVVEHVALEIDPFPRKEGAEFSQPEGNPELSPFAVLQRLRRED